MSKVAIVKKRLKDKHPPLNTDWWRETYDMLYPEYMDLVVYKCRIVEKKLKEEDLASLDDETAKRQFSYIRRLEKEAGILHGMTSLFEILLQSTKYSSEYHYDLLLQNMSNANHYMVEREKDCISLKEALNQSSEMERMLLDMNIKLMEENNNLKQQLKSIEYA